MSARLSEVVPRLRPMQSEDLRAVHDVERASYAYPWSSGIFNDCLRVGYACVVVELDDRIVGYSICTRSVAGEAHLLNLCVGPAHRSLGLARELLIDVIGTARNSGADRLFLEVRPSNRHALALYRSAGFEEAGRRPDYYRAANGREDALVLVLQLTGA